VPRWGMRGVASRTGWGDTVDSIGVATALNRASSDAKIGKRKEMAARQQAKLDKEEQRLKAALGIHYYTRTFRPVLSPYRPALPAPTYPNAEMLKPGKGLRKRAKKRIGAERSDRGWKLKSKVVGLTKAQARKWELP